VRKEVDLPAANIIPIFPDLAGKVAVVTGSSRGIGAATATYLAVNRVKVVVNGRHEEALNGTVDSIRASGGQAFGVTADCTLSDQVDSLHRKAEERFGEVELLLAFAGGGGPIEPIEDVSEQQWNSLITANLTSKFLTARSFLPAMKRRGRGSVVLMCSSAGRSVSQAALGYSCAQAGVAMLTKNLAQQLGPAGIRVNAIAPSAIRNERSDRLMTKEQREELARRFPLQRIGESPDVAAAALFLCSESSSWITGITLDIAGGKVMT
jgi:3-oxoacyl-[acyl-carrier protein] reductase